MNYHTNEQIMKNLDRQMEHAKRFCSRTGREFIGIFAVGSMNYGLDCKESDVDSICLVGCNKEELFKGTGTYTFDDTFFGEHITYWDLRKFFNLLEKGGFNQLEPLFTPYYRINGKYAKLWDKLLDERESIAYMRYWNTLSGLNGVFTKNINKVLAILEKDDESLKETLGKENLSKTYMRCRYFQQCIKLYSQGGRKKYEQIIHPTNAEKIKQYREETYSPEVLRCIVKRQKANIEEMKFSEPRRVSEAAYKRIRDLMICKMLKVVLE